MDVEKQPISIFFRQAMLRTPQGWCVVGSFVINWLLVTLVAMTSLRIVIPESGSTLIYLLILPLALCGSDGIRSDVIA